MEKLGPNAKSLGINVVNKSKEDYVAPAKEKKFEAFKGQGHSLGGGNNDKQLDASFENCEAKEIDVDANGQTCKIQVVLYNNKRVTITVGLKNTVLELYAHVKSYVVVVFSVFFFCFFIFIWFDFVLTTEYQD